MSCHFDRCFHSTRRSFDFDFEVERPANYSAYHITSAHDTSLQNAIELGKSMGAELPEDITVVGIATQHIYDFSEELSPPVAKAVPQAARIVLELLQQTVITQ
jgi:hydrogenase maturation protease